MVDVAYQICAHVFSIAPENAAHAFELLQERGVISDAMLAKTRLMVRFRNLVVHGYLRRNDAIVVQIAGGHLEEFLSYVAEIRDYLKKEEV